jgi:hypothetical protein
LPADYFSTDFTFMFFMPFMVKKNRLKAEETTAAFTCRHVGHVDKFEIRMTKFETAKPKSEFGEFEFLVCFWFLTSNFEFGGRITDH